MKKIYVFAAVAIAALASCTKSEVVYNQGQQEIGFRQFTGSMTKVNTNLSELVGGPDSMGVFAHINASNPYKEYFSNAKFKLKSGNNWGGVPPRYWPLQNKLDFVLYAPYQETGVGYNLNDDKKLTVTIADNSGEQIDYLYGKKWYKDTEKPETPSNGVAVVLKHALSKVTINVKASDASIFTVSSVKLMNTYQQGKYDVTYAETGDDFTSVVTKDGSTSDMEFVGTPDWTPTTEVGTCTASKLVVPSDQTSIVISYKMAGSTADLTATIDLASASAKWETGKHYTYNITLKADEILFVPTVEDWNTTDTTVDKEIK